VLNYNRKVGESMINIKILKINKRLNKEHLIKTTKTDVEYEEYVNKTIEKAHKSIEEGKVRPIECLMKDMEMKYGLMLK